MSLGKKGGGHEGGGGGGHDSGGGMRWLLTYADMITLLLALFIYMYSISTINAQKFAAFSAAFSDLFRNPNSSRVPVPGGDGAIPFPGRPPASTVKSPDQIVPEKPDAESEFGKSPQGAQHPPEKPPVENVAIEAQKAKLDELRKEIEQDLPDLLDKGEMTIVETEEGLMLRLRDSTLFELGSADLTINATHFLSTLAHRIRVLPNAIRIEGHTDNLPMRSTHFRSNWELSGARAASVIQQFIDTGINPQRLSLAGYGEYRPIEPNIPGKGNPANRRVEILLLAGNASPEVKIPTPQSDTASAPQTTAPETGTQPPNPPEEAPPDSPEPPPAESTGKPAN